MRLLSKYLPVLVLPLLLVGCSTTLTNLSLGRQDRAASNLYPVEVAMETREQAIALESIAPTVMIGEESYPMQKVPKVANRWEAKIPVPAQEKIVHYKFKFDYQTYGFGHRNVNSKLSPQYKLEIVDRK